MLLVSPENRIRAVSILANMVFFVVGFNYSFFNALVTPMVQRSLEHQYGSAYAADNLGKFSTILAAAIHVCGSVANPFFGQASDRVGRRFIMLLSILSATVCLISFATFRLYWWLLFFRVITGLFDSTQFMTKVIIGDIVTPETQKKLFSQLFAWFALCLTIGPFIVSLFEQTATWQASGPCLIAGSISLICFVACLIYLPETKPPQKRVTNSDMAWFKVLSRAELAVPIWAYGVLSMLLAAGEICTALFIKEHRGGLALPAVNIGRLFAVQGAAYCFTQAFFSSPLLKKYGNIFMFRVTLAALVALYPLTIIAAHVPMKVAAMAIIMAARVFANSIAVSAINLIINERGSEANALGSVVAVGQSICGFTKTLSLFAIGVIYDILAVRHAVYVPFLLFGACFALLLGLSFAIQSTNTSSSEKIDLQEISPPASFSES